MTPTSKPARSRFEIDLTPRRAERPLAGVIGIAKWILPVIALALIGLVIAWPQLLSVTDEFQIGFATVDDVGRENQAMVNARYIGVDENDRPFTVTAATANRRSPNSPLVDLELPQADITLEDGAWVTLTAHSGIYDQVQKTLRLDGGVNIFHDTGYELRTRTAEVDLNAGSAEGNDPVEGQGPFGFLNAEGFRLRGRGEKIFFTGDARLLIAGDATSRGP